MHLLSREVAVRHELPGMLLMFCTSPIPQGCARGTLSSTLERADVASERANRQDATSFK
jgi:hypothetical protein